MISPITLTINSIHAAYASNQLTPEQLVNILCEQAKQQQNVWIYRLSAEELAPYLAQLAEKSPATHPLYGIPFAIKDNIDLAGVPTTAACPAFSYVPKQSAHVVQLLIEAGAIPLGKTNLDQFATGLVGTRSPYGATPNAFDPNYISGGSSSGSAVACAEGIVCFALGTDTAGSGRVPAAFNNLVGLKPTKGVLSTTGVVPACRSLDCVSIFALTATDAQKVFNVAAQLDLNDGYARTNPAINQQAHPKVAQFKFAIPAQNQWPEFANPAYQQQFNAFVDHLSSLGGSAIEIDFSPFLQAAKLLYEGPWVAERYLATQAIIEQNPQAMLDVTRTIIAAGNQAKATDLFAALYQLHNLKQQTDQIMQSVDFVLTPTTATTFTIAEVNNNPIQTNSQLGYYTNFMNLLDYTAIAIPAALLDSGLPFGVTLFSQAFSDQRLLQLAKQIGDSVALPLGATQLPYQVSSQLALNDAFIEVVVCGAHLSGMALNWQLTQRGAQLLCATQTAPHYQMYAVPGVVERPALIRSEQGCAFEVEVWQVPSSEFGSFVSGIAQPLGIGKVELADCSFKTGFIAEGYAAQHTNISHYGSWRRYKQTLQNT